MAKRTLGLVLVEIKNIPDYSLYPSVERDYSGNYRRHITKD